MPHLLRPDQRTSRISESLALWQGPAGWLRPDGGEVCYEGAATSAPGPDVATPAVLCDAEGAFIRLVPPLELPADWTIACFFKTSADGVPERLGESAPEGWFQGEFALDCTDLDEQRVFYSVGRGHLLGTYSEEIEDRDEREGLHTRDVGFRHCGFSFLRLEPGWHHLAAMSYEDDATRYFLDGRLAGLAPMCIQGRPMCSVGNVRFRAVVGAEEVLAANQPWGHIADLRVYRRALSRAEVLNLARLYDPARDVYFLRRAPEPA